MSILPPEPPYHDAHDLIQWKKLKQLFELIPEFATFSGYHAFDHRLSRADREGIEAEFQFLHRWLTELRQTPADQLTEDQQFDRSLFEHYFAQQAFYYRELRTWERNPDAVSGIGQIIFLTLLYEHGKAEERFANLAGRLEAFPQYLHQFRSRMATPPRRWRDLAIQTAQSMPHFFDAITAAAEGHISARLMTRLQKAVIQVKALIAEYGIWLTGITVDEKESWVLGPEHFAELIRLRALDLTVNDILELGKTSLARYQDEQRRLAIQLVGTPDIAAAKAMIEADAPRTFADALATTRHACEEARRFIQTLQLMDVPPEEQLHIVETPKFLRTFVPFAAIFPPAKCHRIQTSTYVVTPSNNPALLRKHLNHTSIYNTAIHEAYPGHHLQLATANREVSFLRSAPFVGGKPAEYVEGWAHYCEELMKTHGFHNTPAGRFVMVSDLVWRATRIIVDVELSQGSMTYDQGVAMLIEHAHLSREGAEAEVNRYTYSPGYQLSYLIGKHLIMRLKEDLQRRDGAEFSEKDFHNRFLRAGSIPLSLLRRRIFGLAE
ncbi:MAG: DUF885 domain-containing protein [Deltaproteobacteria bacterium]|nr:DUF885 domain-containing protein [Deltaproteobacteria bacterium]